MSEFQLANRPYTLAITLGAARKIKTAIGVDLTSDADWEGLAQSTLTQIDVAWLLIDEQADMSKEQFEDCLMGSGAIDALTDALLQALADFYRKLSKEKMAIVTEEVLQGLIQERTLTASPEFAEKVKTMIHGAVSSNSRVSQELTGSR